MQIIVKLTGSLYGHLIAWSKRKVKVFGQNCDGQLTVVGRVMAAPCKPSPNHVFCP